ncbi:zf-TFIIB domain-containing protein [Chloroflexota bacterium]
MICPKCKQDMIVVEHRQVELDYCTRCEGVWFDAGELTLFLQCVQMASPELMIRNIVSLPAVEFSGKPQKCPICGQGMKEVAIGQPSINIDVCLRVDGLWFDGGELHALLKQLADSSVTRTGSEQPVFEFLGEVFGGTE